jgi:hypothetical protein
MNRTFARTLVPLLLLATVATAEPAVIKVFEAKVHAQPDATSPIVHTFVEKTEVSVSEEAQDGWRRVRLPDGSVGWLQESTLTLPGSAPAAPSTPAAPAPASPSDTPLRAPETTMARVFVKDLDHLAELVKEDPIVSPQAQALASRATASQVTMYGSILTGMAISGVGFLATSETCEEPLFQGASPFCRKRPSWTLIFSGLGLALVGSMVGYAIAPSRNDVLDVLNAWNRGHPDQPFELPHTPSR